MLLPTLKGGPSQVQPPRHLPPSLYCVLRRCCPREEWEPKKAEHSPKGAAEKGLSSLGKAKENHETQKKILKAKTADIMRWILDMCKAGLSHAEIRRRVYKVCTTWSFPPLPS